MSYTILFRVEEISQQHVPCLELGHLSICLIHLFHLTQLVRLRLVNQGLRGDAGTCGGAH